MPQGVEMARFGHPVLFPPQNESVAVMSSKIDMFENYQVQPLCLSERSCCACLRA